MKRTRSSACINPRMRSGCEKAVVIVTESSCCLGCRSSDCIVGSVDADVDDVVEAAVTLPTPPMPLVVVAATPIDCRSADRARAWRDRPSCDDDGSESALFERRCVRARRSVR